MQARESECGLINTRQNRFQPKEMPELKGTLSEWDRCPPDHYLTGDGYFVFWSIFLIWSLTEDGVQSTCPALCRPRVYCMEGPFSVWPSVLVSLGFPSLPSASREAVFYSHSLYNMRLIFLVSGDFYCFLLSSETAFSTLLVVIDIASR